MVDEFKVAGILRQSRRHRWSDVLKELIGGRLDYIDGKAVASIVYRRRTHVINLFVAQGAASAQRGTKLDTMQGFNIERWSARGLEFFAVSDINADELQEFVEKFETALGT